MSSFGAITWNMASGNKHYRDHFMAHIDTFFNVLLPKAGLQIGQIQVIAVQEFKYSAKKKGIRKFAEYGFPFYFWVTRKKKNPLTDDDREGQVIFSSQQPLIRKKKTIVKSGGLFDVEWDRIAQVVQLPTGAVSAQAIWVMNYHNRSRDAPEHQRWHSMHVAEHFLSRQTTATSPWISLGDWNLSGKNFTPFKNEPDFAAAIKARTNSGLDWQVSSRPSTPGGVKYIQTNGVISDHQAIWVNYNLGP